MVEERCLSCKILLAMLVVGLLGSLVFSAAFTEIIRPMREAGLEHPVSLQFCWSAEAARELLRGYEDHPVPLTYFMLADTVYPLFYGAFLFALASLAGRRHPRRGWRAFARLLPWGAPLAVICDWLENALTMALFAEPGRVTSWLPPLLASLALVKWLLVALILCGAAALLVARLGRKSADGP